VVGVLKQVLAAFHHSSEFGLARIRHKKYSPVAAGLGEEEYTKG